jgi:hypothetical protein
VTTTEDDLDALVKKLMPEALIYKSRKRINNIYDIWILDRYLYNIADKLFEDVSGDANIFLDKMEYFEKRGYFIDDYMFKYNTVVEHRLKMRKYL